jgi:hypothetical protein
MTKLYHIARAGQQTGRYVLADLERAVRQGEVRGNDHCWTEGMDGWSSVSSVLGLSPKVPQVPDAPQLQAQVDAAANPNAVACTRCGHRGYARVLKDGDFFARGSVPYWAVIIFFFPISLLFYFHVEQKHKEAKNCPSCGGDSLVPAASPLGQRIG